MKRFQFNSVWKNFFLKNFLFTKNLLYVLLKATESVLATFCDNVL